MKREKKRKRKLVSRSVDVGPRVLTMNSFLPWQERVASWGGKRERKRERVTPSKRCEGDETSRCEDKEKARGIEESERKRETWKGREKFDRRGKLPWKRVVLSHPDIRIGIYRNIVICVYTYLHSIYTQDCNTV